jgi:hypothetical protein|tara:strand:+ start:1178 stop:1351 length:174 start_codon:yes stop_codon:yes gene_type:complete
MINAVEKVYSVGEFIGYKMTLSDGTVWDVPLDQRNIHYIEIQAWAEIDGNNITDPGA